MKFNTSLLHGAFRGEPQTGATLTPIYQSSAFEQESAERLEKIFHNQAPGFSYTRINNPTVEAFEKRMTMLEGGKSSVACASGMAAMFNAFANILQAGDEIVSSASLYGGSIDLFRDLEAFGITTHYVENNDLDAFCKVTNAHTRLYFAETLGNPRLDVTDIKVLAKLAHENGVPLIIDNTAATAYLVKPLSLGADIVVNSTSKYINGNSNSISGVITDGGTFKWDTENIRVCVICKIRTVCLHCKIEKRTVPQHRSLSLAAKCILNSIGLETLGLRMERICDNAMQLAAYIEENYKDITVNYAGLETSNWHEIAKSQFDGHYGGIFTLRLGSKERAYAFINALNIRLRYLISAIPKHLSSIRNRPSVYTARRKKRKRAVYLMIWCASASESRILMI